MTQLKMYSVTDSRPKSFDMQSGFTLDSTWVTATSKTWWRRRHHPQLWGHSPLE